MVWESSVGQNYFGVGCMGWERGSGPYSALPLYHSVESLHAYHLMQAWKNR